MKTFIAVKKGNTRDSFLTRENIELLGSFGEIREAGDVLDEDSVALSITDSEVYLTCWGSPRLSKKILDAAPNLVLLAHLGGTVAPYVSDELWKRGIKVISGNEFLAESTAEGALAYILAAQRDIPRYSTDLKEKRLWKKADAQNYSLIGKTVGVVSYGAVAKKFVRMLQPFRVRILVYDIIPLSEVEKVKYGIEQVPLDKLFSDSDIISVHTPLTQSTRRLIGRELFEKMKPGALFVNTARGEVIDQGALEEVLAAGKIRAVLDVFEKEPPPPECRLYSLPNVMMMPHMAGPTTDLRPKIAAALIRECHEFIDLSVPLRHEIKMQQAENMSEH
ncbi:MAG: hydroxyacid dehydrogenase [Eubacteriales bacterium]|jgi:phosphoglycerate dehydrogenase-like enzyme